MMAMTMAEKVLARTSGRDSIRAGEYVTAKVDRVMAHEAWTICALRLLKLGVQRVFDPEKVIVILEGRKVDPGTRLLVTPASAQVLLDATRAGYIETLLEAGAHLTTPGCGACPGGHGGLLAPGEVCLSSTNRNFRGRMGSPEAEVYLGSPASVAAAAVAGHIIDPRKFWDGTTIQ